MSDDEIFDVFRGMKIGLRDDVIFALVYGFTGMLKRKCSPEQQRLARWLWDEEAWVNWEEEEPERP
jgi:hypothetical protein